MTEMRIASIGLDLSASVSHDPDVEEAWYGFMSNGSGPMVTVRVNRSEEQFWIDGFIVEKPIYEVVIGCKSVRVESDWHERVEDAWEQAREEANLEAPRLAGELRVLEYAEAQRRRKNAEPEAWPRD